MIKVLVNGAFGRMGQITVNTLKNHPNLQLVGQTGREYDLIKSITDSQAEVVIDFTTPEVVFDNTQKILSAGARPVIGTTGLLPEQIEILKKECARLQRGALIVPNFSLGAVLLMKCAKDIVRYLSQVEIIEMHHANKADSPSGTALRTAQLLLSANPYLNNPSHVSHETLKGARGALYESIPIHSVRLPGFLAHEQVIFGGIGETLTIRHDSIDRQCFMGGVCLAAERVMTLNELEVGLESILI